MSHALPRLENLTRAQVLQLKEIMKPAQEIVSRFLGLLVERRRARRACDGGAAANSPRNVSSTSGRFQSSLPYERAPIEVTALTPSLEGRRENEDERKVASAVEKNEGIPERRFDFVEFSPPGTRGRPRSSQTVRGYKGDEHASAGKFVGRYEPRGGVGIRTGILFENVYFLSVEPL